MADIRIKDLATTATTTASDDFMAVDGAINGTRKLSAATPAFLTSVTTPSLTSPAATNLTLAGGSGNTNVVLTPSGTGNVLTGRIVGVGVSPVSTSWDTTNARGVQIGLYTAISESDTSGALSFLSNAVLADSPNESSPNSYKRLDTGGASRIRNGFGTLTIDTAVSSTPASTISWVNQFTVNSAGVSIASTTSGSAGSGALVVAGGISAGAASYFGGNVVARGALGYATGIHSGATTDSSQQLILSSSGAYSNAYVSKNGTTLGIGFSSSSGSFVEDNALSIVAATKAATFAGAVTAGGNVLISNPSSSAHSTFQAENNNGANATLQIGTSGSARAGTYFGLVEGNLSLIFANGTSSTGLGIGTFNAKPLVLGTNNTAALTINATTQAATFAGAVTVTGALKLGNAYVAGAVVGTGSITIQDSTGTTYRIPVLV